MLSLAKHKEHLSDRIYWLVIGLAICLFTLSIFLDQVTFIAVPFLLVGVVFYIVKPQWFYYLLFISLPISFEYYGVLSTDLPSEGLMLLTALWVLILVLTRADNFNGKWFMHPIALMLTSWILWMIVITPGSEIPIRSVKHIAAKSWYILSFFIAPWLILREKDTFYNLLKGCILVLCSVCILVMIRHGLTGFAFSEMNFVLTESYRNHVVYSAILVVLIPYFIYIRNISSHKKSWTLLFLFLTVAMFFAYTRAAYLALIGAIAYYVVMRLRIVRPVLLAGLIVTVGALGYLINNNTYLEYAPEYTETVSHHELGNLLAATTEGKDISSMERVYRWVAGYQMSKRKPIAGYGPGNFAVLYKSYTLRSFQTYVSDNEEGSGMHSYYFTLIVEQGIIGLLIFIGLIVVFFYYAERVYHMCEDPHDKALAMSATLSFVCITIMQTLNELIETDKVGPFFYLSLSIIVYLHVKYTEKNSAPLIKQS